MNLPDQVLWLLKKFAQHDAELFLVGGCVRDFLLQRTIHDYDFTTNATPEEMIAFLSDQPCRIIPTGIKHGTLTILYDGEKMEVTTYRCESKYEQHRFPKEVFFSRNLMDDLARRDFTINAMAYHPDKGLIDPFHGQDDIQHRLIRCVGNSEERFEEDALRILRALRFSFQLQFSLTSECSQAISKKTPLLTFISKERIREEFDKMLLSDAKGLLNQLRAYGILPYIIEDITMIDHISQESKWHIYDVFHHTDAALDHSEGYDITEKLALVFHDFGKAETKTIDEQGAAHFYGHPAISAAIAQQALKNMTYANKIINRVVPLIQYHDYYVTPSKRVLRKFLAHIDMNYDLAYAILRVQYADDCAKNMDVAQEKLENITACMRVLEEMEQAEESLKRSDLALNGHDLKELGLTGKQIGEVLQWLYQKVIDEPSRNTKESLNALVQDSLKHPFN